MSEELPRKKSIRAAHRAGATRMVNQVGDLLGAETVEFDEPTHLQTNLSTKSETLEALDAQIVDLTPDAELEDEIGRAKEYLEKIQRALLKIGKVVSATPTRTGLSADAIRPSARGGGLTDETTGVSQVRVSCAMRMLKRSDVTAYTAYTAFPIPTLLLSMVAGTSFIVWKYCSCQWFRLVLEVGTKCWKRKPWR